VPTRLNDTKVLDGAYPADYSPRLAGVWARSFI
jgi:hypothetical protein